MINKIIVILLLACCLIGGAAAQKQIKTWVEWSKKDAQKILNDSAWGQTQIETDTSELFFQPTAQGGVNSQQRNTEGATNQATSVKYRIRFFSSRPIRMALTRLIELDQKTLDPQISQRLRGFAELQSRDSIIVTVTVESTDQRYSGRVMQDLNAATSATLRNSTYLERKDGKRLFLEEYVLPGKDGFGARFIFPRAVDGQPFLTPDAGEVRFYSEIGKTIKLTMRFKVSEMMYDGHLEY